MQSEEVKSTKMSPFEIADGIFLKTGRIDPIEAGYDAFMMNRIAANNYTDVFFAAELNRFPGLSKEMSYSFYYNALDRGKRYGRWHKSAKNEEIGAIARAYNINVLRAAQYHRVLSPDQIAAIVASLETGGAGKTRKAKARI